MKSNVKKMWMLVLTVIAIGGSVPCLANGDNINDYAYPSAEEVRKFPGAIDDIQARFTETPTGDKDRIIVTDDDVRYAGQRGVERDPYSSTAYLTVIVDEATAGSGGDRVTVDVEGRRGIRAVYWVTVVRIDGPPTAPAPPVDPVLWAEVLDREAGRLKLADGYNPDVFVYDDGVNDPDILYCQVGGEDNKGKVIIELEDAYLADYQWGIFPDGGDPDDPPLYNGDLTHAEYKDTRAGIDPGAYTLKVTGDNEFKRKIEFVVVELRLVSVSFSGDNYHVITEPKICFVDGLNKIIDCPPLPQDYDAPHWQAGAVPNDPPEREYPVAFTRNTKPVVSATWIVLPGNGPTTFIIKGVGPKIGDENIVFMSEASRDGNELQITNVEGSRAFANEIGFFDPFEINWTFSVDDGETWQDAGKSINQVYVTLANPLSPITEELAPPTNFFHTVVHIGCTTAQGKSNAGEAFGKIWEETFKTLDVQRVEDGHTLTYWKWYENYFEFKDEPTPWPMHTAVSGFLRIGDGRCGAWTRFMHDTVKAHGIGGVNVVQILPDKHPDHPQWEPLGLHVKLGLPAQGVDEPFNIFGDHSVVFFEEMLYDPSYGMVFPGDEQTSPLLQWQRTSLAAVAYKDEEEQIQLFDNPEDDTWPLLVKKGE